VCLSREVRLVAIGERGEAVGEPVGGPVGAADGERVRVRLDLLVLEGRAVAAGDVVLVDCGFALEVVGPGETMDEATGERT
jgi:hydrogenase maturation factor